MWSDIAILSRGVTIQCVRWDLPLRIIDDTINKKVHHIHLDNGFQILPVSISPGYGIQMAA